MALAAEKPAGSRRSYYGLDSLDGRIKILLGKGAGRRKTVSALRSTVIFMGDWSFSPAALSVLRRESKANSLSKRLVETRAARFFIHTQY
jgi:hypothetical protein